MTKSLLLFIFCIHAFLTNAQNVNWKQQANYSIDVKLNDNDRTLDGFLTLQYKNNSPDTLHFVWFQLWPNAFKNDRTAYSEHLLDIGRNDFYFSDNDKRGYINRLEFRSGNDLMKQESDPSDIDLVKLMLPAPLAPRDSINITTPFHIKLPYRFAAMGYEGNSYNLVNWYPAVSAYDANGWHQQPYIGQSISSAEESNVYITLHLPERLNVTTNALLLDSLVSDSMKTLSYMELNTRDLALLIKAPRYQQLKAVQKNDFDARINSFISNSLRKSALPAIGYNVYDGIQIGALVQNLTDTGSPLTYYAATLYALRSSRINGTGGINYTWQPKHFFTRADVGVNVAAFSIGDGNDSNSKRIFAGFYKIAPYVRLTFPSSNRHIQQFMEWRTFIIGEQSFDYLLNSKDSVYYPATGKTNARYVNQLTFRRTLQRSLYPYDAQLQLQQAASFYRLNAELHYFFNYAKGGGMQVRLFAAKFGYLGPSTSSVKFETMRYQPKLTAINGYEDYTYSDYFIGRNEFNGFPSQQVMMRDGGLKIRTDMFQDLQGRSDNWIASLNANTSLPDKLFPVKIPLRIFLDAGTYAEAWKRGSALPRFLYVAGLQLSLLKNIVNIYAPLIYSREFSDNLKTIPEQNKFSKRISFSIDLHRLDLLTISRNKQPG